MVELNFFIFQIVEFYKIVSYSEFVNYYIIGFFLFFEFFLMKIFRRGTKISNDQM